MHLSTHDIDYYADGRMRVAFCKKCGAEGENLQLKCTKAVDNKTTKN